MDNMPKSIVFVDDGIGNMNSSSQGWILGFIEGVAMVMYEDRVDVYADGKCDELIYQSDPNGKVYSSIEAAYAAQDRAVEEWPKFAEYTVATPIIMMKASTAAAMTKEIRRLFDRIEELEEEA